MAFQYISGGQFRLIGAATIAKKAVVDATNSTPIVITCPSHGFSTGDIINISNVSGNTAANGIWAIIAIDGDTFSLVNSVGSGVPTLSNKGTATPVISTLPTTPNINNPTTTSGKGPLICGTPPPGSNGVTLLPDGAVVDYKVVISGTFEKGVGVIEDGQLIRSIPNVASDGDNLDLLDFGAGTKAITSEPYELTSIVNLPGSITLPPPTVVLPNVPPIGVPVDKLGINIFINALKYDNIAVIVSNLSAIRAQESILNIAAQAQSTNTAFILYAKDGQLRIFINSKNAFTAAEMASLEASFITKGYTVLDAANVTTYLRQVVIQRQQFVAAQALAEGTYEAYLAGISNTTAPVGGTSGRTAVRIVTTTEQAADLALATSEATRVTRTTVASAPVTRLAAMLGRTGRLGLRFLTGVALPLYTAYEAGWILNRAITAEADLMDARRLRAVQGRLQITNLITNSDADRCGFGNIIKYVPIYQEDPGLAAIQLSRPSFDLGATRGLESLNSTFNGPSDGSIHNFPICTVEGRIPVLDLSAPSPISVANNGIFNISASKLPDQSKVKKGIPADIFICYPKRRLQLPADTYERFDPAPPDNRYYGSATTEETLKEMLPRLFYLNWYSATARNNGAGYGPGLVGHSLVSRADYGLCLEARSSNGAGGDGGGGFIIPTVTNIAAIDARRRENADWLYVYLGTVLPVDDGIVQLDAGYRLIYNQYNRLPYRDIRAEPKKYLRTNRWMAVDPGANEFLHVSPEWVNVWQHYFLNPALSTDPTVAVPRNGQLRTTIFGPLKINVRLNNQFVMKCTKLGNANADAFDDGVLNCSPTRVDLTNLRVVPENGFYANGLNTIDVVVQSNNSSALPLTSNYGVTGDIKDILYIANYGYITDSDDANYNSYGQQLTSPLYDRLSLGGIFGLQGEC